MFTRLTFPLVFSSRGTTVVSRIFTNDGHGGAVHQQYIGFYTCLLACVHVEPARPTLSTAPPLPCEAHPAQRPPVGNPTQRTPLVVEVVEVISRGM